MRISDWSSDVCSADLVDRLGKTVGGINIDVLNVAGRARDMVVVGRGKSELEAILARWSARQDRVVLAEPTPERGYFYRFDHFRLAKEDRKSVVKGQSVSVRVYLGGLCILKNKTKTLKQ